jgi:hypothetical protein
MTDEFAGISREGDDQGVDLLIEFASARRRPVSDSRISEKYQLQCRRVRSLVIDLWKTTIWIGRCAGR